MLQNPVNTKDREEKPLELVKSLQERPQESKHEQRIGKTLESGAVPEDLKEEVIALETVTSGLNYDDNSSGVDDFLKNLPPSTPKPDFVVDDTVDFEDEFGRSSFQARNKAVATTVTISASSPVVMTVPAQDRQPNATVRKAEPAEANQRVEIKPVITSESTTQQLVETMPTPAVEPADQIVEATPASEKIKKPKKQKAPTPANTSDTKEFEDAFRYAQTMPNCAEKYLMLLLAHFKIREKTQSQGPLMADELDATLENLKLRLDLEQLGTSEITAALTIVEQKKESDFKLVVQELTQILLDIQPLDMSLMINLIHQTEEAAQKIKDQAIILFIGPTGAGKSTTIHFSAGAKMHKVKVKGGYHIEPKTVLDGLESVLTSSSTTSVTRNINAVTIDYAKVGAKQAKGTVMLCDSPGFGDTAGAEVDIANGIGLVNALKESLSVKPVIVISEASIGDRWQGLASLAQTLVMFFSSIGTQLSTISYVFTKFHDMDLNDIHEKLREKLDNLSTQEKTNQAFVALLKDMIKKTKATDVETDEDTDDEDNEKEETPNGAAVLLDPINDDAGEFLDNLAATPVVSEPASAFQNFLTTGSLSRLKAQLEKLDGSIRQALARADMDLLLYKLNQLKTLSNELKFRECKVTYAKALEELAKYINDLIKLISEQLETNLKDGNKADPGSLQSCNKLMQRLVKFEAISQAHLQDKPELLNLNETCRNLLSRLQADLLTRVKKTDENNFQDPLVVDRLNKMRLLAEIFKPVNSEDNDLEKSYREASSHIQSVFQVSIVFAQLAVDQGNLVEFVEAMDNCAYAITTWNEHLDISTSTKLFEKTSNYCVDYITKAVETARTAVSENLRLEDVQRIVGCITLLNNASTVPGITPYISKEMIASSKEALTNACVEYFQLMQEKIKALLVEGWKAFPAVNEHLKLLHAMHQNAEIGHVVNSTFTDILDQIKSVIAKLRSVVNYILSHNLGNNSDLYRDLKDSLLGLNVAECFSTELLGSYGQAFNEASNFVKDYVQGLAVTLETDSAQISNPAQIFTLNAYATQLSLIATACGEIIPDINDIAKTATETFEKTIVDSFQKTTERLSKGNFFEVGDVQGEALSSAVDDWENIILYVDACSVIKLDSVQSSIASLREYIAQYVAKYVDNFIAQPMEHAFAAILDLLQKEGSEDITTDIENASQILLTKLQFLKSLIERHKTIVDRKDKLAVQADSGIHARLFRVNPQQLMEDYCKETDSHQGKLAELLSRLTHLADTQLNMSLADIRKHLIVAQALIKVDAFLTGSQKYVITAALFEGLIRRLATDIKNKMLLNITILDCAALKQSFEEIKATGDIPRLTEAKQEVTSALTKKLQSLNERAAGITLDLSGNDTLRLLSEDLARFDNISVLAEYLDNSFYDSFETTKRDIYTALMRKVKFLLSGIDTCLSKNDFLGAEKILDVVATIEPYLAPLKQLVDETVESYREKIRSRLMLLSTRYQQTCELIVLPRQVGRDDLFSVSQMGAKSDSYYVRVNPAPRSMLSTSRMTSGRETSPLPVDQKGHLFYVKRSAKYWVRLDLTPEQLHELDVNLGLRMQGVYLKYSLVEVTAAKPLDAAKDEIDIQKITARTQHSHVTLGLNLLSTFPPKALFDALEQVASGRDAAYSTTRDALKRFILEQLTLFLNQIQQCEPEIARKQISYVMSLLKALPTDLAHEITTKIAECETYIAEVEASHKREMEAQIATGTIKHLMQTIENHLAHWRFAQARSTKLVVDKLITDRAINIGAILRTEESISVLDNSLTAFEEWATYIDFLKHCREFNYWNQDDYEDNVTTLCKTYVFYVLIDKFNEAIGNLDKVVAGNVRAKRSDKSTYNLFTNILNDFALLKKLFELKEKSPRFYAFLKTLDNTLEDRANTIFANLVKYFGENQQFLNEILREKQVQKALIILNNIRDSEPLLRSVSQYCESRRKEPSFAGHIETLEQTGDYQASKEAFSKAIPLWANEVGQTLLKNPALSTLNPPDRNDFYSKLYKSYQAIDEARKMREHIDSKIVNIDALVDQCLLKLKGELEKIELYLNGLVETIVEADADTLRDFNIWYDNLRACKECFEEPSVKQDATLRMERLEKKFNDKLQTLKLAAVNEKDTSKVADLLVKMTLLGLGVPAFRAKIKATMDEVLKTYDKQKNGSAIVGRIALSLTAHKDSTTAQMILNEQDAFQGYALSLRNTKTLKFTITDVIGKLDGTEVDKDLLKNEYTLFDKEYWALVFSALQKSDIADDKRLIISNAKIIASGKENYVIKVRRLMAHLFAHWTLDNSQYFLDARDSSKSTPTTADKAHLMQPHAAQVVSIFRLLGTDMKNNKGIVGNMVSQMLANPQTSPQDILHDYLRNHFDEMLSGEGKSVTLAIIAATLALLGFKVGEACYSRYLSDRDYKDFMKLFEAFSLTGNIRYGTFTDLCEDMINDRGDIRELVIAAIKGDTSVVVRPPRAKQATVGVIDETDVLLDEKVHGNLYRPIANLTDATITKLIFAIWEKRKSKAELRFARFKETQEYKDCCARFRGWESLIEQAVRTLLADVQTFDQPGQPEYVIEKGQIAYKEHDGISFDVSYGYKTMWAYFNEYDNRKVNKDIRDSKIAFYINCGSFSYAQVAKSGFDCLLGATGTLQTLGSTQKQVLSDSYGVNKSTYTPSVYGNNQLEFRGDSQQDVKIADKAEYFNAIAEEIKARLKTVEGKDTRSVMVFFETTEKLKAFYNSAACHEMKGSVITLTEELDRDVKESIIRKAATTGTIVLCSGDFARGTDFRCYDTTLNDNGGPHVLGTFLPDLSWEIQMQRRTARQGGKGSFSYVLASDDLTKFGITETDIINMRSTGKYYTTLNAKRNAYFEREYKASLTYEIEIQTVHQDSLAFKQAIVKSNRGEMKQFLTTFNSVATEEVASPPKIMILIDATGSMSALLEKAQNTVGTMCERANQVLAKNGLKSVFKLQLVFYRNYNTPKKMLVVSPWESDPVKLRNFMKNIHAEGGSTWGEEAVEVALQYANQECANDPDIRSIMLIGDMPPNTQVQISDARANFGGNEKPETYYKYEIDALAAKKIPVYPFYVHIKAKESFDYMASATDYDSPETSRRKSEELDINSTRGADMLTDLVTQQILNAIGGEEHGAKLVATYRDMFAQKFERGYVSSGPR